MATLDHVQITALPGTEKAMEQFYIRLGFIPTKAPTSTQLDVRWYIAGTAMVHIAFVEEHKPQHTPHIAVRVPDVNACMAELGVSPLSSATPVAGSKVLDPAGNTVELLPVISNSAAAFDRFAEHLDDPARSQVHWACEKPALLAAIGPVAGLRIVDFGCGVGDLTSELLSAGADQVIGTDIASSALAVARKRNPGPTYVASTSPLLDSVARDTDLVVSSLVMHYIEDWTWELQRFRAWLRLGGRVVLSILHPFETALERGGDPTRRFLYGRVADRATTELLGRYQLTDRESRPVDIDLDGMPTTIFHHGFSTILRALHGADLRINDFLEPGPDPRLEQVDPDRFAQWERQPKVLIISASAS